MCENCSSACEFAHALGETPVRAPSRSISVLTFSTPATYLAASNFAVRRARAKTKKRQSESGTQIAKLPDAAATRYLSLEQSVRNRIFESNALFDCAAAARDFVGVRALAEFKDGERGLTMLSARAPRRQAEASVAPCEPPR